MTERTLVRGGHVLTMDPAIGDLPSGDVLIDGDRITAVGTDLDPAGATVVDAGGQVVLPGFVDSHRHLWQSALRGIGADLTLGDYLPLLLGTIAGRLGPEDVRRSTLLGAVEALDAGVTTVVDFYNAARSAAHVEAALAGLEQAGIRAVFGHGDPDDRAGLRRLAARTGLVTGALATLSPEHAPLAQVVEHLATARELGLVTSLHVGCGAHGARAGAVTALGDAGLLGPDLHFVHGNTITDDEVRAIADSGAGITVTPGVEFLMGHGPGAYGRFAALGVPPALGTDVAVAAGAGLFDQMRAALWQERLRHHEAVLRTGQDPSSAIPAAAQVLRSATVGGAAAVGLADRTGSLTPGKQADLVLISGLAHLTGRARSAELAGAVVTTSGPADVRAVLVGGRFAKRDGRLVAHDLDKVRDAADEVAVRVLAR